MRRRLDEAEDGRVVFSFGTNDTTVLGGERRVRLSDSIDNFETILTTAQSRYPTLAISPLPLQDTEQNDRTSELANRFAEVAAENSLKYLNIFDELRQGSPWMDSLRANDGYHPLSDGYEYLAARIGDWNTWQNWMDKP